MQQILGKAFGAVEQIAEGSRLRIHGGGPGHSLFCRKQYAVVYDGQLIQTGTGNCRLYFDISGGKFLPQGGAPGIHIVRAQAYGSQRGILLPVGGIRKGKGTGCGSRVIPDLIHRLLLPQIRHGIVGVVRRIPIGLGGIRISQICKCQERVQHGNRTAKQRIPRFYLRQTGLPAPQQVPQAKILFRLNRLIHRHFLSLFYAVSGQIRRHHGQYQKQHDRYQRTDQHQRTVGVHIDAQFLINIQHTGRIDEIAKGKAAAQCQQAEIMKAGEGRQQKRRHGEHIPLVRAGAEGDRARCNQRGKQPEPAGGKRAFVLCQPPQEQPQRIEQHRRQQQRAQKGIGNTQRADILRRRPLSADQAHKAKGIERGVVVGAERFHIFIPKPIRALAILHPNRKQQEHQNADQHRAPAPKQPADTFAAVPGPERPDEHRHFPHGRKEHDRPEEYRLGLGQKSGKKYQHAPAKAVAFHQIECQQHQKN